MKIRKPIPPLGKWWLIGLVLGLGFAAFSAQAQTVSSYAIDDAVISQAFPDSAINQSQKGNNILAYRERIDGALKSTYSMVKFDISHLKGVQVTAASMSYRGRVGDPVFENDFKLDLFALNADFVGDTVKWRSRPAKGTKLATSFLVAASTRKDFTNDGAKLVDYINEEIRKGKTTIGFAFQSAGKDTTTNMWLGGDKNGNFGPVLNMTLAPRNSSYSIDDAVISQFYPDSVINQGQKGNNLLTYRERINDTLRTTYSMVKFDISHLKGSQVTEATLSYRGVTSDVAFQNDFKLDLFALNADFVGATATWRNRPAKGTKLATSFLIGSSARKDFANDGSKLIDYINEEIRKGKTTIGFAIQSSGKDTTTSMWLGGTLNGNFGPILNFVTTPNNSRYAIDDAIVSQAFPDSTINQSQKGNNILAYRERVDGALKTTYSMVKFDISHLRGTQISEASLSYRGRVGDAAFDNDFKVDLYALNGDFVGDTVKWRSRPARGTKLATSFLVGSSARKSFTNDGSKLVDYINEEIRKGKASVGFVIQSSGKDTTTNMWIGGDKNGNFGPILNYTVSPNNSFYSMDDAVVSQAFPDSTINQSQKGNNLLAYRERVDGALKTTYSMVKFDLSNRRGMLLQNASFSYRGRVGDPAFDNDFKVDLYALNGDFVGDTVKWRSRPARGTKLATSFLVGASTRKDFVNDGSKLVDYINEEIRKGKTSVGFVIQSAGKDTTTNMWLGGTLNGNFGPVLNFTTGSLFVPSDDSLKVIEDAYVLQAFPDSVAELGKAADMHILKTTGDNREVFLKFAINKIKDLAGDVRLKMYLGQHNSGTQEANYPIEVYAVGNNWDEDTLKWRNKPAQIGTTPLLTADVTNFGSGMYYYLVNDAFTNYVNTAMLEGRDTVSVVVKAKDAKAGRLWTAGKEWKNEAWLIFNYSTPPPVQELNVIDDAYTLQEFPDSVAQLGKAADMHIIRETGKSKEVYLRFDLNQVRAGQAINAGLDIYIGQHNSGTQQPDYYVEVLGVANTWDEDTLKWSNRPAANSAVLISESVRNFSGGSYRLWTTEAFTAYVNEAIRQKQQHVSFVVRGRDLTPGNRLWTAGKEWKNSAKLRLSYDPIAATPTFLPVASDFVDSVNVRISATTTGAQIYYTLNGTEPTNASMLYNATTGLPLKVTSDDSLFTIKAVAIAPNLMPSIVATKQVRVVPVSVPVFDPNPAVEYTDFVTVKLTAQPASALIFYSDVEGVEPSTPYPAAGITLTSNKTIRAVAVNASGTYTSPVAEAAYKVITTVPGTGNGPGGVGAEDNTIAGQPENALWLKADAITAANGTAILEWEDASGNDNHARNSYVEGATTNRIPNTAENQKPAPTLVSNALNGLPVLDFGKPTDAETARKRTLVIDDADNLDGGAGISIFMVFKRNEMFADFASVFQKRNSTLGPNAQAYVLEFDGGSNPHRMQYVIARDIFLKQNIDQMNAENYYIVNVELQGDFQQALFRTNGELLNSQTYRNIIQAVDAPVILGGFQSMNVAEVIMYKKGLNAAQNKIVHNYLAAKWGLNLAGGKAFTQTEFLGDVIGIGKETYPGTTTEQTHASASGGGLQLDLVGTYAAGQYLYAGHDKKAITNPLSWQRTWYIQPTAANLSAKLSFNFTAVGLDEPSAVGNYKLWFDNGSGFTSLNITPVLEEGKLAFTVNNLAAGKYGIGTTPPGTVEVSAPTFSLAAGTYQGDQQVTITTATAGADIYYTTNGSTPTTASTKYTAPVTISTAVTLKAMATLNGVVSPVTEAAYTITPLGLEYQDISNALVLFPNPNQGKLNLYLENGAIGEASIRVLDFTGKTVLQTALSKKGQVLEHQLSMEQLSGGLYMVEVILGKQRAVKRVLKE